MLGHPEPRPGYSTALILHDRLSRAAQKVSNDMRDDGPRTSIIRGGVGDGIDRATLSNKHLLVIGQPQVCGWRKTGEMAHEEAIVS